MGKMIRKHLFAVLAGACVLFAGLTFAACGGDSASCEHKNAAAGTNTATCTAAGEIAYTCPDCGASWTEPSEALGHLWDAGTASETTLCTEARVVTYTCTRAGCGETKEESLPAAAAHALDEGTVNREATCTEDGERTFRCTNDGCTYTETQAIPSAGEHKLDGGTVTKKATCTTAEEITYKCTVCDHTETRTGAAALGHAWDSAAACVERHCTRDGCEESLPATAKHTYAKDNARSVAATCEQDGKDVFVCSACNDSYETKIEKFGHLMQWETSQEQDGCKITVSNTGVCMRDGCTHEESLPDQVTYTHTYVTRISEAATCAHGGVRHEVCSSCGEVKEGSETTYTDENAHTWKKGVTQNGVTTYTCENNPAHIKTAIVSEGTSTAVTKEALSSADEVSLGGALIAMDADTVGGLDESDNYTLAAEITTEYPTVEGGVSENVFSITLSNGTENITDFNGTVTVSLPYELKDGDNIDAIYIGYINENGEIEEIVGTYSNEYVTFTTTHFSFYTVRQYTAAQMCEKHGHAISESSTAATCLTDGFILRVCTRCGQILENRVVPALGHSWGEATGKEATCTTAGTMTKTCTRCDATSVVITPAYGHEWIADAGNTVAATCTTAGKEAYTCAHCGDTYTITIAALGHALRETVTQPTCTERGFTEYTCTRDGCGFSYTANVVAALGHAWDLTEPTCGRGQICTVCGAAGAPATGNHTMENGVCTVCGQGCDHNFVKGEVVAPTCTERGYTVYTCSACGSTENREYTDPAGHTYKDDWTKCSVCRAENPAVETVYGNIVKDMMSGEYIISTQDVQIVYTLSATPNVGQTVTVDLFEAVIKFENGKLLFSANGKMEMEEPAYGNRSPAEFRMYGDGAYVWMDLYNASIHGDGTKNEYTSLQVGTYESTIFSMFGTGAPAQKVAEVVGMIAGLFNGDNGMVNDIVKALMQEFLLGKAVGEGYEFTLDHQALQKLNQTLYEKNVAAFVDAYFGDGSYDSIINYIRENEDTTLDGFKTYVLDNLESMGVDRDGLVGIVNTVLTMASGTPTDLDELIAAYPDMTIGQVVCQMFGVDPSQEGALESVLTNIDGMCKGTDEAPAPTVYALLGQMMGIPAETLELIYDTANAIFAEGEPELAFKTDANGFISDLTFGTSALELAFGDANYIFDVLADVKFDTSEGLEENLGLKTEISEKSDAVLAAIKEACEKNGGIYQLDLSNYNGSTITFTLSGGVLSVVIEDIRTANGGESSGYYDGELCYITQRYEEVYIYTISDASALTMATLQEDCGEAYSVQIMWSVSDASSDVKETRYAVRYYSVSTQALVHEETRVLSSEIPDMNSISGWQTYCTFYYDPVSGELGTQSFHQFTKKSETVHPDSPCEAPYWYEVCAVCGAQGMQHFGDSLGHLLEKTVEYLNEGSTSCEEGIRITEICTRDGCDYENTYTSDRHELYTEERINVPTDHNNEEIDAHFIVGVERCLCGEEMYIRIGGDCYFKGGQLDEEKGCDVYHCAVEGCNIWYEQYNSFVYENAGSCYGKHVEKYVFYQGDTKLGEVQQIAGTGYQHEYDYEDTTTKPDTPQIGDEWTVTKIETCTRENCPYHWEETKKVVLTESGEKRLQYDILAVEYDGSRREESYVYAPEEYYRVTEESSFNYNADGERTSGYTRTYVYEGCWATVTTNDIDGGESIDYQEIHAEGKRIYPTCTQYGGYLCPSCGSMETSMAPREHAYDENGICMNCGLVNAQQGEGPIAIEDLSGHEIYAEDGKIVLGIRSYDSAYTYENVAVTLNVVGLTEEAQAALEGFEYKLDGGIFQPGLFNVNECGLYLLDRSMLSEALAAAVAETKLTLEDFGVEVSFVPTWVGETGYVCSITLTNADITQIGA